MRRRTFVRSGVLGVIATGAVSGCIGGGSASSPPPRNSEVFGELSVSDGTIQIPLVRPPTVESRAEVASNQSRLSGGNDLAPVGRARAGGRGGRGGRSSGGATGRASGGYTSAPKGRHGRAVYLGTGDDDEWREDHDDEIDRYRATHQRVGVAYLGNASSYEDDPPDPGPVSWDETWAAPEGQAVTYDGAGRQGWYRVGSKLEAPDDDHSFGWSAVDFEVDVGTQGYRVENPWKVAPRL